MELDSGGPPFLGPDAVRSLVSMSDAVDAIRAGYRERADDPPRSIVSAGGPALPERIMLSMPTALGGVAGCKLVTLFPDNVGRAVPAIQGIYVLFSADDGRVRALLDGGVLTRLRTPAASAVATDCLAMANPTTLGIFGTGVQAEAHLDAMLAVRPSISEVIVVSGSNARADRFASRMQRDFSLSVRRGTATETAGSDIVCTCTTGSRPLFEASDVSGGAHINAIGAFKPSQLEFGPDVVAGGAVFVDGVEGAKLEAGDLIQAAASGAWGWNDVAGDLSDLVNGRRPGDDASWSLFKGVGMSIQDLIVANLAADRAGLAP